MCYSMFTDFYGKINRIKWEKVNQSSAFTEQFVDKINPYFNTFVWWIWLWSSDLVLECVVLQKKIDCCNTLTSVQTKVDIWTKHIHEAHTCVNEAPHVCSNGSLKKRQWNIRFLMSCCTVNLIRIITKNAPMLISRDQIFAVTSMIIHRKTMLRLGWVTYK